MSGNSTVTTAAYSVEGLTRWFAGHKNGNGKNIAILRSVSSIVSVQRSSLHNLSPSLLLGMAISDILFSLPMATFGAMDPTDMSYVLWNATVIGVVGLVNKNYNTVYGGCTLTPVYDPPHCEGLEDGTVREGFTIPCGRGRNKSFFGWYSSIVLMVPPSPFIIIIAFGMIYWSVRKQEKMSGRYGAGTLNLGASAASSSNGNGNGRDSNTRGSARSSIGSIRSSLSSISRRFRRNSSVVGNNDSNSRAVMHRICIRDGIFHNLDMGRDWRDHDIAEGEYSNVVPIYLDDHDTSARNVQLPRVFPSHGEVRRKEGIQGGEGSMKEKNSQSATMTDTSAAPTASTCRRSSLLEQVQEEEKVDIDIEAAPQEEDDEFSTLDQRLEEEKVNIGIDAAPEDCGSDSNSKQRSFVETKNVD
eukprot:scaffold3998_cov153-Skeletonema_dohrnii-CCMP3373.AAC.17